MKTLVFFICVVFLLAHSSHVSEGSNPIKSKYPKCSTPLLTSTYFYRILSSENHLAPAYKASEAGLNSRGICYKSDYEIGRIYLDVQFHRNLLITGIALKGVDDKQFVRSFKLRGERKITGGRNTFHELLTNEPFKGNKNNGNEIVYNYVRPMISSYVRFFPIGWAMPKSSTDTRGGLRFEGRPCFRLEFYGCLPVPNMCANGIHDCDENATCIDNSYSFKCKCKTGYSGDGHVCNKA